jgi:hypothetical protein
MVEQGQNREGFSMTSPSKQAWAHGGLIFAATMLGIAAIANGNFFIAGPNYAYAINTGVWGWIHLLIGLGVVAIGYYVYTGADWARGAGIAIAAFSALSQFFFLPYYPAWGLLIIAIDIFVIWSLTVVRFE